MVHNGLRVRKQLYKYKDCKRQFLDYSKKDSNAIRLDDVEIADEVLSILFEDTAAFFNLINSLHEKVSLIITTNKSPTEWVETLDDEALASALLDRLLYKCEVIKLSGASYRMENRQTILKKEVKQGHPRNKPITE